MDEVSAARNVADLRARLAEAEEQLAVARAKSSRDTNIRRLTAEARGRVIRMLSAAHGGRAVAP